MNMSPVFLECVFITAVLSQTNITSIAIGETSGSDECAEILRENTSCITLSFFQIHLAFNTVLCLCNPSSIVDRLITSLFQIRHCDFLFFFLLFFISVMAYIILCPLCASFSHFGVACAHYLLSVLLLVYCALVLCLSAAYLNIYMYVYLYIYICIY